MKQSVIVFSICLLLLAGCKYEAPLTQEHRIPIDEGILGLWELMPDNQDSPPSQGQMLVLKFCETEYLIQYTTGEDDTYLRGYPIQIGEKSCVQLQIIGDDAGPPTAKDRHLYEVAAYTVSTNELVVHTLNSDLVDPELTDSTALRNAFLEVRNEKELFTEPGIFRKIEK